MLIGLLMKKIARSPSQSASLTLKTMGLFSDIYSRDQNDEEIINAKISELKITTLSEAAQKSLWAAVFINRIMRDPPTFEQLQK